MATCLNEVTTNMFKKLTIVDVMCPVCRGIFIEPVLMPCNHALCLQCFERTMEENSLSCPLCRKRIGSWLRTATKDQNLVNSDLWAYIQKRFPDQVKAKLNGEEDGVEEHVVGRSSTTISCPGEIRKEYELHLQKLQEEARKKHEVEIRASEDLIRKIQEEEKRQYLALVAERVNQAATDEQIAKEMQEQSVQSTSGVNLTIKKDPGYRIGLDNKENKNRVLGSLAGQMKGPMDAYLHKKLAVTSGKYLSTFDTSSNVKFGNVKHKAVPVPELEKVRSASNMSSGSHDSINQEMHHFKPIKSVPRTPPKKLSDGRVLVPMVVKAVPVNLNPVYESLNESGDAGSCVSFTQKQLMKVQMDRIRSLKGVLRTSEVHPPFSAFRGKASVGSKTEALKPGCDSTEREQNVEDVESPRKKQRKDMECWKSSFSLGALGSYGDNEGKKVIAIVHSQADDFVEMEGKIGGHDRRFGGSEKEVSCKFGPSEKVTTRDDSNDYGDADVARSIGVEPESDSQTPVNSRYLSKKETSSSGVNSKLHQLSLSPVDNLSVNNHKTICHNKRNNLVERVHNNNNDIKTSIASSNYAQSSEQKKENVDEIVPQTDSDESLSLLTQEQTRIEKLIRQEQEDLELALRLQNEWDAADRMVDRSKGSLRAYELRNAGKTKKRVLSKKNGRGRQSTLEESFTGTLRSNRKR